MNYSTHTMEMQTCEKFIGKFVQLKYVVIKYRLRLLYGCFVKAMLCYSAGIEQGDGRIHPIHAYREGGREEIEMAKGERERCVGLGVENQWNSNCAGERLQQLTTESELD